jgi:hypothetical protein
MRLLVPQVTERMVRRHRIQVDDEVHAHNDQRV